LDLPDNPSQKIVRAAAEIGSAKGRMGITERAADCGRGFNDYPFGRLSFSKPAIGNNLFQEHNRESRKGRL